MAQGQDAGLMLAGESEFLAEMYLAMIMRAAQNFLGGTPAVAAQGGDRRVVPSWRVGAPRHRPAAAQTSPA